MVRLVLLVVAYTFLNLSVAEEETDYEQLYDDEISFRDRLEILQDEGSVPLEITNNFISETFPPDSSTEIEGEEIWKDRLRQFTWLKDVRFEQYEDGYQMFLPKFPHILDGEIQKTIVVKPSMAMEVVLEKYIDIFMDRAYEPNTHHINLLEGTIDCRKPSNLWFGAELCVRGMDYKFARVLDKPSLTYCFEVFWPYLQFGGMFCFKSHLDPNDLSNFIDNRPTGVAMLTIFNGGPVNDPDNALFLNRDGSWIKLKWMKIF